MSKRTNKTYLEPCDLALIKAAMSEKMPLGLHAPVLYLIGRHLMRQQCDLKPVLMPTIQSRLMPTQICKE